MTLRGAVPYRRVGGIAANLDGMPTVEVNHFVMHYRDARGSGAPVVFLHGGFPSIASLWDQTGDDLEGWEKRIAATYRWVTFARRGHHPSSCPTGGYSIDNQAVDTVALMDHLAIDSAHVVGSSAGGPIGYCLAARFPTRVRSLVLVGTGLNLRRTLRDRPGVVGVLTEHIDALHRLGAEAASHRRPRQWAVSFDALFMADEFTERGERQEHEERTSRQHRLLDTVGTDVRACFHAAELHAIEAYLGWDGRHEAASVACPTLVMHGENDRAIVVEEGAELAELVSPASFETFPASHSLLWRHEPALVRALDFIAATEERRAT